MSLEDRLREYVQHVSDGGDPYTPSHPLGNSDHEVWVSWRTERGDTRIEIAVDDERYGCFVNGEPVDPSCWEGGVSGPAVDEWEAVRRL